MAVVGGGAIGCEFASMLSDLGATVTVFEALPTILNGCDEDVVKTVARSFRKRGIEVKAGVQLAGPHPGSVRAGAPSCPTATARSWPSTPSSSRWAAVPAPRACWPPGTGVVVDERGFVVADRTMRTRRRGVWAVGDVVAGTPQLAHVGFAEGIVVIKGILGEPVVPVDYGRVPWAIYCHPEVAFAGLTEAAATRGRLRRGGEEGPLRRQQPGPDHRGHRGSGQGGGRTASRRHHRDGSSGSTWSGPWVTEQLGAGYLAVNWEATADEVAQFIQPHPSLSETFGETVLALTGRGLHVA